MKKLIFILQIVFCLHSIAFSQNIHHWESLIYHSDNWDYKIGNSEPNSNWNTVGFDASSWLNGKGGFGYDDNDDNTIIPAASSVYLRLNFSLMDTSKISYLVLNADYDDGFVAFINGKEIARNNVAGNPPKHSDFATTFHEATVYSGGEYESFVQNKTQLKSYLNNGINTLAIQVHNSSLTSSDLSSNFYLSAAISDNSNLYKPIPNWFKSPLFTTNLPLFLVETLNDETIENEPKIMANLSVIHNAAGGLNTKEDAANVYDGLIGIEIRGASSQTFAKKNFTIETRLADSSSNNVELLGLPKENDWVLHGPYADKSLLRNVLAYNLGTHTNQYTPRTQLCELFINNDYRGVYMLTEKIKRDKNRVNISKLKPEDTDATKITGGYIFQIDRDDASTNEDGWWTNTSPGKFVAYHDPKYDELVPAQKEYLKTFYTSFETAMQASNYQNKYQDFVDVESWVDYFLVTEIAKHIDAYKLSFFMHKQNIKNGGKIKFGPLWDFNLGFGNFDFACSPEPQGWSYEFQGTCDNSHPFWIRKLTEIPNVADKINCRWQELRSGPYNTDSLLAFINDNVSTLDAAQKRNFERWQVLGTYVWPNYYVGDTYSDEVKYLKDWLKDRLTWMDNNMIGICQGASYSRIENTFNVNVFPNPTTDFLYIEQGYAAVNVVCLNGLGARVFEQNITSPVKRIDLSGFAKGVYTFQFTIDNLTSFSKKVILN